MSEPAQEEVQTIHTHDFFVVYLVGYILKDFENASFLLILTLRLQDTSAKIFLN